MTDIATRAREAAYHFEAKKTGFGQAQDGWSITFRVQHNDMPAAVKDALKGTRYQLALVEILDNEEPKPKEVMQSESGNDPVKSPATQPPPSTVLRIKTGEAERRRFSELSPVQQAGILCNETGFQVFVRDSYPEHWREATLSGADGRDDITAEIVRTLCGVKSRKAITADNTKWPQIVSDYRTWEREAEIVPA